MHRGESSRGAEMKFAFEDRVITVNTPSREALLAQVAGRLERGQGFALATLNLDHLVKLSASAQFRAAYAGHDLIVADGNPVVWLSRLARRPVSLVQGADLVLPLTRLATRAGVSVALVGSTDEALARAETRLRAEVPGLEVAARIAPRQGFEPSGAEAEAVIARLRESGARLCLLALGAPKQELFAAHAREALPEVGFAGIGAGLDFLAGRQRRAPRWVRRLALEWLWRMLSSPARLGPRYLRCARVLPGHVVAALRQRRTERG